MLFGSESLDDLSDRCVARRDRLKRANRQATFLAVIGLAVALVTVIEVATRWW